MEHEEGRNTVEPQQNMLFRVYYDVRKMSCDLVLQTCSCCCWCLLYLSVPIVGIGIIYLALPPPLPPARQLNCKLEYFIFLYDISVLFKIHCNIITLCLHNTMYSVLGYLTTDEEPCVFPFIYEGKAYNQCTAAGNRWPKTAWCPTKVDNNSEYIQGHYGRCKDPNCKQLPGKYLNFNKGRKLVRGISGHTT